MRNVRRHATVVISNLYFSLDRRATSSIIIDPMIQGGSQTFTQRFRFDRWRSWIANCRRLAKMKWETSEERIILKEKTTPFIRLYQFTGWYGIWPFLCFSRPNKSYVSDWNWRSGNEYITTETRTNVKWLCNGERRQGWRIQVVVRCHLYGLTWHPTVQMTHMIGNASDLPVGWIKFQRHA